jgi:hypothetical protein
MASPEVASPAAPSEPSYPRPGLPLLFAVTIFTSAALLFLVQPMVAKMLLPLFGGAPAVWTTCLLFYQTVLLLGYLYADAVNRRVTQERQVLIHSALLLGALALLPIELTRGAAPAASASPTADLLVRLTLAVGLPFFALSGTGTLLQGWFSRSGHRAGRDPYFLYAASNLGSMAALLSYPSLLEPRVGLLGQSDYWTAGFITLVVLSAACGLLTFHARPAVVAGEASPRQRLVWIGLAFVPSTLMMGVTLYLTIDIAPVPLLWVLPLSLYLLAFILAFARLPRVVSAFSYLALPAALLLMYFLFSEIHYPNWVEISLHLLTLLLLSTAYLGKLAALRPPAARLTEFYFWISLGGVLGGVFNALLAPFVFKTVAEYPMVLVGAALLLPGLLKKKKQAPRLAGDRLLSELALALAVAFMTAWLVGAWPLRSIDLSPIGNLIDFPRWRITTVLTYALPVLASTGFLLLGRRLAFAGSLAAFAAICAYDNELERKVVLRERSFFSVLAVEDDTEGDCRHLMNGTTPHGRQRLALESRGEPLFFYHRDSPIGDVFGEFHGPTRKADVAVVGLGAGTLAAYGEPGQRMTFYEIDPAVARIAINPDLFTYLKDSAATVDIVLGDARLKLAEAKAHRFGLLVIDAFSSDAIPVHLLTREALDLYLEKLAPDGLLAFHVSNRYLQLTPIVGRLAREAGLTMREQLWIGRDGCGPVSTRWVLLAREEDHLGKLRTSEYWKPIHLPPETPLWTDDYSNLLTTFYWDR